MSAPTFGTRITTTTQEKMMAKVVDIILNSNVFATRMLSSAKRFSGEKIKFPLKYKKNTTGTSFSGFDTLSTSATDNRVNMYFPPKKYSITCALPLDELTANEGEEQVINLMKLELASTAHDAADDIGIQFYSDGTGNDEKDFLGLEAIVDDTTNTSTYGGLTRSSYSGNVLKSTVTSSSGTLTIAKMATLFSAVSSGSQSTTLGLTTETVFNLYGQLLQPAERIARTVPMVKGGSSRGLNSEQGLVGGTGFTSLFFSGFPILADEKCTSGVMYFLNEDYLNFYGRTFAMTNPVKFRSQSIEGNDYSEVEGLGFSWTDWKKPTNAMAVVSHIVLYGELITENPKRHGKLTAITGV